METHHKEFISDLRTIANYFITLSSRDQVLILIATISDTTNFNKYAFQYKSGN